jgi:hypothetical protein
MEGLDGKPSGENQSEESGAMSDASAACVAESRVRSVRFYPCSRLAPHGAVIYTRAGTRLFVIDNR